MGRHYKIPTFKKRRKVRGAEPHAEKFERTDRVNKRLNKLDSAQRETTAFLHQHATDVLGAAGRGEAVDHRPYAVHLVGDIRKIIGGTNDI